MYINIVLAGLVDVLYIVYLDDILIFTTSESQDEHWRAVRRVLRHLRPFGLYTKLSKCVFCVDRVEFLGFIVSRDGVKMDPSRVVTITN